MKLMTDILYWRLKEKLSSVTLKSKPAGKHANELVLNRPEFYLDRTQHFEKNCVYVCSADHLPQNPRLNENVCLVCLGTHWNLNAYYGRASVILVEGNWDIFRVFNAVQEIFNRYDAWEEKLHTLLRHGANLTQMLNVSNDIFGNPSLLIGSDFRYLAVTEESYLKEKLGLHLDTQSFDVEKMATFLTLHDISTHVHEPLLLELQGNRTLSVNIFDQEEYLGCFTLFENYRCFQESDKALAVFFSKLLQQAIQQNPVLASTRDAVRRALRSVIAGESITFEYRRALSAESEDATWLCVKLIPKLGNSYLPGAYLSAALEERYAGAFSFELGNSVAACIPVEQAKKESAESLLPVLEKLGIVCGVSSPFENLYDANHAWFQASAALQNGLYQNQNAFLFYFQDYLLPQLLNSATGGRPTWVFYTEGLKRLKEHDTTSQVSYMHTLRVYLDNSLSVTKTAAALFLHRSTLLERLSHITALLGNDLKDPDYCLTLSIILRAELEQGKTLGAPQE